LHNSKHGQGVREEKKKTMKQLFLIIYVIN